MARIKDTPNANSGLKRSLALGVTREIRAAKGLGKNEAATAISDHLTAENSKLKTLSPGIRSFLKNPERKWSMWESDNPDPKKRTGIDPGDAFILLGAAVELELISPSHLSLNQLGPMGQSGRRPVTSAQVSEIFEVRLAEAKRFADAKRSLRDALKSFEAATVDLKHSKLIDQGDIDLNDALHDLAIDERNEGKNSASRVLTSDESKEVKQIAEGAVFKPMASASALLGQLSRLELVFVDSGRSSSDRSYMSSPTPWACQYMFRQPNQPTKGEISDMDRDVIASLESLESLESGQFDSFESENEFMTMPTSTRDAFANLARLSRQKRMKRLRALCADSDRGLPEVDPPPARDWGLGTVPNLSQSARKITQTEARRGKRKPL